MQMKQKASFLNNCLAYLGSENLQMQILYDNYAACIFFSTLIVDNFSDKKLKKLYPDWKFMSHFKETRQT